MKRLSILVFVAMLSLTLSGTGFTRKPSVAHTAALTVPLPVPHTAATAAAPTAETLYYWYTAPDDTYNDRQTIEDETYELWIYYGTTVNTNPAGGVLVSRGYRNDSYPHNQFATIYLFAHYY